MAKRVVLRRLKYAYGAALTLRDAMRIGKSREQWKRLKKKWNRCGIDPLKPIGWVEPVPIPTPAPMPLPEPLKPEHGSGA